MVTYHTHSQKVLDVGWGTPLGPFEVTRLGLEGGGGWMIYVYVYAIHTVSDRPPHHDTKTDK